MLLPLEMGEPFLQFAPVGDFLSADVREFVAGVLLVDEFVVHAQRIPRNARRTREFAKYFQKDFCESR